jgi:predicted Ser/Thr protein kinase
MIGLGWMEILLLLVMFAVGAAVFVFVMGSVIAIGRSARDIRGTLAQQHEQPRGAQAAPGTAFGNPNVAADDADVRQTIVARLTQRFCPQCRAALAADAPEGLCPACLMAGALVSGVGAVDQDLAATTPPSGSQPPATGEWANLAARFPQLEILEMLGRGGMGTVYKARQKNLDRWIALKVIPPEAAADPAFAERFAREARAMARLNHPNIVTVYDFGHEAGLYWLMMEYVDGVNLRHTLRAGHLQPREALAIVPQVCDALQYAHDQGVVHRDIKPENVLLDRSGRVKIADFGLAKLLGKGPDDFTLTRTQQVMGTPRYMAPEQIERPTAVDHRADIYSLGVVLYEMLTGELPLGRFEPPSHRVELDVRIDQVVLRALEKSPERRYQRASEIKTDLASSASWAKPAAAAPPQTTSVPTPPTWRTPAPANKDAPTYYPSFPGGVPLGLVLLVAFGIVIGVLMMTLGLAAGVYATTWGFQGFDGSYWGWMGAAFGCVVGGFGSAAGSYNTYRQMAGAEDLMRSPRVTWFDWVMRVYLALGVIGLFLGATLVDDDSKNGYALLTLGGIAVFQGGLFVIWRTLVVSAKQQAAKPPATGDMQSDSAQPGYLRAVAWPTLAIAGVFALLWADVHFSLPLAGTEGVTAELNSYRTWHDVLLLSGVISVGVCGVALALWRIWGPRNKDAAGVWQVPPPLAHRGWLFAIAALAGTSLFLPWLVLQVGPQAEVVFRYDDAYSGRNLERSGGEFTAQASDLRVIAFMPADGRFASRGLQAGRTMAPALLLMYVTVFSAFVFGPRHPARIGFLLVGGGMALVLVTMFLHDAADQEAATVVDKTMEQGLYTRAGVLYGSQHK